MMPGTRDRLVDPQPEVKYGLTYRNVQVLPRANSRIAPRMARSSAAITTVMTGLLRESERAVRVIEKNLPRFPAVPA